MNEIFDDDVRLEGISFGKNEFSGEDEPSIVITQGIVEAADANDPHATDGEIEKFMANNGFVRLEDTQHKWHREADGIVVFDTKVHNFIRARDGVFPIDVIIGKKFAGGE
jgi:hypothetical protein